MKTNPTTSDIHVAMARVEKARGNRTNAAKRHSRAQAALETASKDVADAEKEFAAASAQLDQAVKKALGAAMKKGGTDMSIALAEIIARSMTSEEEAQLPLEGGEATSRPKQAPTAAPAPSTPSPAPTSTRDADDQDDQDDQDDASQVAGRQDAAPSRVADASAEA